MILKTTHSEESPPPHTELDNALLDPPILSFLLRMTMMTVTSACIPGELACFRSVQKGTP